MDCRAWILVGMMGAGKSAVGRALAQLSARSFADTDQLLQNRFGRAVYAIFDYYGEEAFRSHETSILKGLEPAPVVLATGGGIVMRDENWIEMRRLGTTIFLDVPIERLIERLTISKKRRPLLEVENWQDRLRSLMERRRPLYERADIRFEIGEFEPDVCAEQLLERLEDHS